MQINSAGLVIGGVGQAGVYLAAGPSIAVGPSKVVAPPAGQAGWLDNSSCLYQAGDGELRRNWITTGQDAGTGDRLGVSLVRGANGQYGVWIATATGGVRGSINLPDAKGILGAADDGTLFTISADYTAIEAWTDGALRWRYDNAYPIIYYPAPQFSCLDADRCCWWNAKYGLQTRNLGNPPPQTWGTPTDPFIADLHGTLYLGYHSDRFYLHPFSDKSKGWIVATGDTYYTCGRTTAGKILCAWATDPSEIGIVTREIDPRFDPMVDLTPPPEPLPPVVIAPFHAPIYVGPFFATGQYGNVDHPGNCEVLIRADYVHMVRQRPCFADMDSARSVPDGMLRGIYTAAIEGGSSDANIEQAIAYSVERQVPVLIYSDTNDYAQWICDKFLNDAHGKPIPNRIPVVQAYPKGKHPNQPVQATPAEDVARIRRTVAELATIYPRVAIAHTYYTQSGNYPLSHILAMQEGLAAIERDYKLFASLGFACLRPSGMSTYPELAAAFKEECRATPGEPLPVLLPVTPVPPEPTPIPPHPQPPEPHPPEPTPIPPEDHMHYYGERLQIRPYGSFDEFRKVVVVRHQDEEYLDKRADGTRNLIYGVSTDFTTPGNGHIITFSPTGEFQSDTATIPAGAERVTFDGANLMVARPGCAKNGDGTARLWEVVRL